MFLGIDVAEPEILIETFIAQTGWTHPVAIDQGSDVYEMYQLDGNISPFPLDYIIDRDGIVAYGMVDYDPIGMRVALDLLLAECDPAISATCAYIVESGLVQVRFYAPIAGSYQIWKSINPGNDGSPDNGADPDWELAGIVNVLSPGSNSLLTNTSADSYAIFVVVHSCD